MDRLGAGHGFDWFHSVTTHHDETGTRSPGRREEWKVRPGEETQEPLCPLIMVRSARSYTTVLCMHHSTWKLLFRHCSIRVSSMDPLIFVLDSAREPEIKGCSTRSGIVQTGQSNFLDFITSPILLKNIYYSTYLKKIKTAKD
jgi:hypothetical protein